MRLLLITQKADKNDPVLGFFHRWIIEFAKHFEEVIVICLWQGVCEFPANVRVISLGKEEGSSKPKYLRRFYRTIWAERARYDAVFVHMNQVYVLLGALLWKLLGKQVFLWYTHRSVTLSLRAAVILVDKALTASSESLRIRSKKVTVLGHGIDTAVFSPTKKASSDSISIVTVGRISPVKRYETLIQAFSEIRSEVPIFLDIAGAPATRGDESYLASLRALAAERGVSGRVRFKGAMRHDTIPALLRASDIFVNMSRTGSVDKAVLEAMSCGVPAVTSNVAFQSMLSPYGLFFKDGDVQELARILGSLVGKRDTLTALGAELRAIVLRDHDLMTLIGRITNLYE
ncbi:MAG: glycosyltransferase family 4 protein [Candidatus Paceibacterota bacterium]|jgi:glycosyltransferase involved in cell wall biosynthesis